MTMLEVLEPARQRLVHRRDSCSQTVPMSTSRFAPNRRFQFGHALATRPAIATLKVVTKKVEATSLRGVHDAGLLRMQPQASLRRPLLHFFERRSGFGCAATENDEVSGIAHHLIPTASHLLLQRVKIDFRQQGANHRPLRRSRRRRPVSQSLHHFCLQHRLYQFQHSAVCHFLRHLLQQLLLRYRVEVALQISIDDPGVSCFEQVVNTTQRIFAAPTRTKPIAVLSEVSFEDRFQHVTQRRLYHSVTHRRNAQRSLLATTRLGYPLAPHRLRTITAVRQLLRRSDQVRFQVSLKHLYRLVVHSCGSLVGFHFRKGRPQIPRLVDFVYQTEPDAPFHPHFEGGQHSFSPDRWFGPSPAGLHLSDLFSFQHWRRFGFHWSGLFVSTFLRSLPSTPVTELHRYYGRSDSCLLRLFGTWSMNSGSFNKQVSLIHASSLPDHSVSNHLMHPCRRFRTLPLSPTAFRFRFRLRHCYAGSPIAPGRIEFVILRTGRSPPAALHSASRRRSCSWLQAGERIPEEDFHLSDYSRFQAHIAAAVRPWIKSLEIKRGPKGRYFSTSVISNSMRTFGAQLLMARTTHGLTTVAIKLTVLWTSILHAHQCQAMGRRSGPREPSIALVDCPRHCRLVDFASTNGQQGPDDRTNHVAQESVR